MNSKAHLEDLVAKYIEGRCCPGGLKALEALLLHDAENRQYFLEIVMLAENLRILDGSVERQGGANLLPVENLLQRRWWHSAKVALLAAAAVIPFSAVAIWPQMDPEFDRGLAEYFCQNP